MDKIIVNKVKIDHNKISVDYSVSNTLSKYFNLEEEFFVEFEENIEDVPKGIAVIPFVVNILPIIWLTDSILELRELDEAFYYSINEFKKGYIDMYENVNFKGKVIVKELVDCSYNPTEKCATFFSGGLDSYSTLVNHLDDKPDLVSLWGSDVTFEDEEGWQKVKKNIIEVGEKYNLKPVFIKSSFRRFIDEGMLTQDFIQILNDNWWHGVQHGIGLIGHIAPYAWKYQLSTQYIASSFSSKSGKVTCASYPTIDNYIKFGSCNIVHDQFEFDRQDKIEYIVKYCKEKRDKILLRVCWISSGGENCCKCEKCYRTIIGILAEGEDPNEYGFIVDKLTLKELKKYMSVYFEFDLGQIKAWDRLKSTILENKDLLKNKDYYRDIKWILNFDFYNYERNFFRRKRKLKEFIYSLLIKK